MYQQQEEIFKCKSEVKKGKKNRAYSKYIVLNNTK